MDPVLHTLADLNNQFTGVVAIGGAFAVAIVGVIAGTMAKVARYSAREKSRREIAAYIAEGSMTPEQGERLMRATPSRSKLDEE